MNYDIEMQKQIELLNGDKKTLLLHACCAPCSSAVIERLMHYFKITIFFYNPNITSEEEYNKRIEEMKRFLHEYCNDDIKLIEGKYEKEAFLKMSKGLEKEKERGPRCYKCYEMRIKETAKQAKELEYDFFTTTLSLSPYKNSDWINELGKKYSNMYQIDFLYSDFKKNNGYKRSIELSKQFNLYRQNYCGCIYSEEGIYLRPKFKKKV